jgi:hypothetical protein
MTDEFSTPLLDEDGKLRMHRFIVATVASAFVITAAVTVLMHLADPDAGWGVAAGVGAMIGFWMSPLPGSDGESATNDHCASVIPDGAADDCTPADRAALSDHWPVGPAVGLSIPTALEALDVEPDRQQVSHIERFGHVVAVDEIVVFLDLDAVIGILQRFRFGKKGIDLVSRVAQQAEMVVARALDVDPLLGDENELTRHLVGAQQETDLSEDRNIARRPAQKVAVEAGDVCSMNGEFTRGKGEFHVVEPQWHTSDRTCGVGACTSAYKFWKTPRGLRFPYVARMLSRRPERAFTAQPAATEINLLVSRSLSATLSAKRYFCANDPAAGP